MGKVNVLDKHLAELIAAGEVVERPASIVKELLENSIDAGASNISVEIKNGGISYIRIIDNGSGISKEDLPKVFLRHATSKISNIDDLHNIMTLGFRGEALASISAVSHVEILSKTPQEQQGNKICVSAGQQLEFESTGCPNGTIVTIRDLFHNVPARRKFLKRASTEAAVISSIVDKIALSNPSISLKYIKDGKTILNTAGNGELISSIYSVMGSDFVNNSMELDYKNEDIKINGYISNPNFLKPNRYLQYFFLNGRYIRSKICISAIDEVYKENSAPGRYPVLVMNIFVPPESVDINVHPSKIEVKFQNDSLIYNSIYACVKKALKSYNEYLESSNHNYKQEIDSSYAFSKDKYQTAGDNELRDSFVAYGNLKSAYNSYNNQKKAEKYTSEFLFRHFGEALNDSSDNLSVFDFGFNTAHNSTNQIVGDETIIEESPTQQNLMREDVSDIFTEEKELNFLIESENQTTINLIGELFKTYILVEYDNQFFIIDKHVAHEKILYDDLKLNLNKMYTQLLVDPISLLLSREEYQVALENIDLMHNLGYLIEDFGQSYIIIREAPSILENADVADTLIEIINNIKNFKKDLTPKVLKEKLDSISCRNAIKARDISSPEELLKLSEKILRNSELRNCPHGRPIVIRFTRKEIEKMFGRIK